MFFSMTDRDTILLDYRSVRQDWHVVELAKKLCERLTMAVLWEKSKASSLYVSTGAKQTKVEVEFSKVAAVEAIQWYNPAFYTPCPCLPMQIRCWVIQNISSSLLTGIRYQGYNWPCVQLETLDKVNAPFSPSDAFLKGFSVFHVSTKLNVSPCMPNKSNFRAAFALYDGKHASNHNQLAWNCGPRNREPQLQNPWNLCLVPR